MAESNQQDSYATPEGWHKVVKRRKSGKTAGKYDIYYYNPEGLMFRSKLALQKHLNETGSSLPIDLFNFQSSKETMEIDPSPFLVGRRVGRKKGKSKKVPEKYFGNELSYSTLDQPNSHQSEETSRVHVSPSGKLRAARKRGRSKKAPQTNFDDVVSSSSLANQLNKEASDINLLSSSADELSDLTFSSEVNEDLSTELTSFTSSLERYSNVLLLLIPLDQGLDHEPMLFMNLEQLCQDWSETGFSSNQRKHKYGQK